MSSPVTLEVVPRGPQRIAQLTLLAMLGVYLGLAFLCHPGEDDFWVHEASLHGVWGSIKYWYSSFSGRYFARGMEALVLNIFDFSNSYFAAPLIVIISTLGGLWFLFRRLTREFASLSQAFWLALIIQLLYFAFIPSIKYSFYTLNAMFVYQMPFACFVVLLALLARPNSGGRGIVEGLACGVLAFLVSGASEILMGMQLEILVCGAVWAWTRKKPGKISWALALTGALIGALLVLKAPGTATRGALSTQQFRLPHALAEAGKLLFWQVAEWALSAPLLVATVFMVPLAARTGRQFWGEGFSKKIAICLPIAVLGLVFSGLFVIFFATTSPVPVPRTLNVIYLVFVLGWFASWHLALGLWAEEYPALKTDFPRPLNGVLALLLAASLCGLGNAREAWMDIQYNAWKYHRRMQERLALIKKARAENQEALWVPELGTPPVTVGRDDMIEDPNCWLNVSMARYYGLKAIATYKRGTPMPKDPPKVGDSAPH